MNIKKKLATAVALGAFMVPTTAALTASASVEAASSPVATVLAMDSCSGDQVITTSSVKLRSGPSTSYRSLVTIPAGTSLRMVDCAGGYWWHVKYNGRTGYVYGDYIRYPDFH